MRSIRAVVTGLGQVLGANPGNGREKIFEHALSHDGYTTIADEL